MFEYSIEIIKGDRFNFNLKETKKLFNELCKNCLMNKYWFHDPIIILGKWKWLVISDFIGEYVEKRDKVKEHLKLLFQKQMIKYGSW